MAAAGGEHASSLAAFMISLCSVSLAQKGYAVIDWICFRAFQPHLFRFMCYSRLCNAVQQQTTPTFPIHEKPCQEMQLISIQRPPIGIHKRPLTLCWVQQQHCPTTRRSSPNWSRRPTAHVEQLNSIVVTCALLTGLCTAESHLLHAPADISQSASRRKRPSWPLLCRVLPTG